MSTNDMLPTDWLQCDEGDESLLAALSTRLGKPVVSVADPRPHTIFPDDHVIIGAQGKTLRGVWVYRAADGQFHAALLPAHYALYIKDHGRTPEVAA